MRKHLPSILLMASFLTLTRFAAAQDAVKSEGTVQPMSITECPGWASHGYCNLILNSQFTVAGGTPDWSNPFVSPYIAGWAPSHGSPQINNVWLAPADHLPPGTNAASMWASGTSGEGIVGNIPAASPGGLNPGTPYLLSFYRRVTSEPAAPAARLDEFKIVLIKCADRAGFPGGIRIPAIPAGSQTIYCESSIQISAIPGYQRIVVRFVPQSQYDLIWIFPRQTTATGQAWLHVAFPQIFREDLVEGPHYWDEVTDKYYLGFRGGYQPGYTELCHEINTKAEWFGPTNNLLWSATVRGSYYPNSCPYAAPCPATYGPITATYTQNYTFKQTFLGAITTSNTCSQFVTSRNARPFLLRMATNPQQPPAIVTENVITKDAAFIRYEAGNHKVVVRAESVKEQPISMSVYDMQGKTIKKYNSRAMQGTSNHTLHLQDLAAGVYFANVQLGNNWYSSKFSVQK